MLKLDYFLKNNTVDIGLAKKYSSIITTVTTIAAILAFRYTVILEH